MKVETQPHPPAAILAAFSTGKLDDADFETVASHLESCADCRAQVEHHEADSFVVKVHQAQAPSPVVQSILAETASDGPDARGQPAVAVELPPELASHPKYEIRKQLGRGGMGTVYLAHDRDLDRDVAIKVMSPDLLARANALERFKQEAKSAARLPPHPNIVQVHSLERAGPLELIVMEYVRGIDLEMYVRDKGPLPVALACHLLRQAAMGLQHAFEHGLVHRDIKPNNLIVNQKGHLKILDFGLAKPAKLTGKAGLTGDQAIMGTVEYMAPEQAMSARDVDIRADLYSLGCTAYYLLTGRPPFVAPDNKSVGILMAHQAHEPPSLRDLRPDVPEGLAALIARLLAKLPQDRFQKPVELAQALTPWIKRSPDGGGGDEPRRSLAEGVSPAVTSARTVSAVDTSKEPTPRPPELTKAPSELVFSAEPRVRVARGRSPGLPRKWLIAAAAGVVGLILAGIVIYVETNHGQVKIELNDPAAKVEVLLDGTIAITDLDKTYKIKAGAHELVVTSKDFETVTKSFTVKRGDTEPVRVTLVKRSSVEKAGTGPPTELKAPATGGDADEVSALVERLGGKVRRDFSLPGKPLIEINLLRSKVSDDDLRHFSELKELRVLILGDTRVSDAGLAHLKGLTNLQTLDLGTTDVTDEGLAHLQGMTHLRRLELFRTATGGIGLAALSALSELRILGLEETHVRDAGLEYLKRLTKLEALNLNATNVSDAGLDHLVSLTNIREFHVRGTRVTEAAKRKLQAAWAAARAAAAAAPPSSGAKEFTNSIGMKLALLPAGEFLMGSPDSDPDAASNEKPQRTGKIAKPFYLGVHEITVGQFRAYVSAQNVMTEAERAGGAWAIDTTGQSAEWKQRPKYTWKTPGFKQEDDHPVIAITWTEANAFCAWLSAKEGRKYRLPSGAEWEYACRAGTTTRYATGDDVASLRGHANVADAALHRACANYPTSHPFGPPVPWDDGYAFTSPVGKFPANAWGLYDMHGNVRELVGPQPGFRGGSFSNGADVQRSADLGAKLGATPWIEHRADFAIGFRVVCEVAP